MEDNYQTRSPQQIDQQLSLRIASLVFLVTLVLVILVGVGTGFGISRFTTDTLGSKIEVAPGGKVQDEGIGIEDEKTLRDSAEGILRKGGVEGEGTHHLERNGGPSQNVYLTSSVINLDEFAGKKIKVWGETFQGQKAGWLMDVGRIKIID